MATLKQKLVAKKIVENRGKSVSKAMREVGYSNATAKNPSNLTESLGWQELISKYLSEDKLVRVHLALLEDENWRARADALDKAYKILGKYKEPERLKVYDPYENMTDEEIEAEKKEIEERMKRYKNANVRDKTQKLAPKFNN